MQDSVEDLQDPEATALYVGLFDQPLQLRTSESGTFLLLQYIRFATSQRTVHRHSGTPRLALLHISRFVELHEPWKTRQRDCRFPLHFVLGFRIGQGAALFLLVQLHSALRPSGNECLPPVSWPSCPDCCVAFVLFVRAPSAWHHMQSMDGAGDI